MEIIRQFVTRDDQFITYSDMTSSNVKCKYYRIITSVRPVELGLILKRILNVGRSWVEIDELRFFLDPCTAFGQRVINTGAYEPDMTRAIKNILRPGDCFIDIGGNEGYFSIIAARRVGRTGKVYCIEPQSRLWPVILNNLNCNGISNCTVVTYGISDSPGVCDITLYPTINTGASSMVNSLRGIFYPKQRVDLISLDQFVINYAIDSVHLMKIDIEGFELNALRSGNNVLSKKYVKNILIEFHPNQLNRLHQSPNDIFDLMKRYGYQYSGFGNIHRFSC